MPTINQPQRAPDPWSKLATALQVGSTAYGIKVNTENLEMARKEAEYKAAEAARAAENAPLVKAKAEAEAKLAEINLQKSSADTSKAVQEAEDNKMLAGGFLTPNKLAQITLSPDFRVYSDEKDVPKNVNVLSTYLLNSEGNPTDKQVFIVNVKGQENLATLATTKKNQEKIDQEINKLKTEIGDESKKYNDSQFTAARFAHFANKANNDLESLVENGFDPTTMKVAFQGSNFYPEIAKDEATKKYQTAQMTFINSVLRKDSGAAINKDEYVKYQNQYFPKAGDSKDILNQKRNNRLLAVAGLQAQGGGAYDLIAKNQNFINSLVDNSMPKTKGNSIIQPANAATPKFNPENKFKDLK